MPPELLKSFFHCFYNDIHRLGQWRALRNEDVWQECGFEYPPARRTLSQLTTDFAPVVGDMFIELTHELAKQVPLGKPFRIDGTNIHVDERDDDAS